MSRDQVIAKIRKGLAEAVTAQGATSNALHARWHPSHAPLAYQRQGSLSERDRVALFAERLHEFGADFAQCASAEDIPSAVAALLDSHGKQRLALPSDLPAALLPADDAFTWLRDDPPLSNAELNAVDGVVTFATVAVAVSGSVALQHGAGEGRRVLTLLPDFHLCLLRASQLVETLPEALDRLGPTAARPTTFFSGPSATADIEMTRIKGVHGPRFLAVLMIPG